MSKNMKLGTKIGYENTHSFESNIFLSHKSHKISLGSYFEVKYDAQM